MNTYSKVASALVALTTASISSNAYAGTLDFQTLSDGVTTPTFLAGGSLPDHTPFLVGSEYASSGVVFSSEGETDPEKGPVFGKLSGSIIGGNIIVQDYKRSLPDGATFNIRADFSVTTDFVKANVYAPAGYTATMSAYDMNGFLLGDITSAVIANLGDSEMVSLSGLGPIAYVIWESSNPFVGAIGIDDLQFSTVPIPGAIPLLLSGLAGLGFSARKKKKNKVG